jgi:hypothetical protein
MPIDIPISDLARAKQHDAERLWPMEVKISFRWRDKYDRIYIKSEIISADAFFGTGSYGAPMDGAALIGLIERMRREGPPKIVKRIKR